MRLYLLDSDDTDLLYGGDREHRIRQEIVLGVGGARALRALGLEPTVFHMNEGHAAFLGLERARALVAERGLSFPEALALVRASTVFTTHTPVPAGNEQFDEALAQRYLDGLARDCGVTTDELLALGRVEPGRAGLRDDAAGAPDLGARERRLGAPRLGLARNVERPLARSPRQ